MTEPKNPVLWVNPTKICTTYFELASHPIIVGGRYGLGSKDTTSTQIKAVYDNLKADTPKTILRSV